MLPSILVRDRIRGDAARVDDVTSWATRRSPHAIVPDAEAGAGPSYTPLGLDAGIWELPPLVPRLAVSTIAGGLLLGALSGAVLSQKGRRVGGGLAGAILGALTGLLVTSVAVQTAALAGEVAAARVGKGVTR